MDGAENSNPETTETDESVDSTESPRKRLTRASA